MRDNPDLSNGRARFQTKAIWRGLARPSGVASLLVVASISATEAAETARFPREVAIVAIGGSLVLFVWMMRKMFGGNDRKGSGGDGGGTDGDAGWFSFGSGDSSGDSGSSDGGGDGGGGGD